MSAPRDYSKHYAAASDDDLLRLADDVVSLLPRAREALRAEMGNRGLPVEKVDWNAQPVQKVKMGGWLLVYCFGAVIIQPIWLAMTLYREPLSSIFLLPYGVILFVSGVLLWKGNPRGLVWVRRGFLLVAILACLMLPLVFLIDDTLSFINYIIDVSVGSIPVILWWMYFRKSKHVREVYGKNMDGLRRQKISVAGLENRAET